MLTFAMIKPHVVKNPIALNKILQTIEDNSFKIVRKTRIKFNQHSAEKFYEEHKGKFYFNRLITFMMSGETEALILERNDAIKKWRELLGPTKVFKTIYSHPESIRGLYGITDTRNACHGSDSEQSVIEEIRKIFPDFEFDPSVKSKFV
ncbi:hypothetical protein PVAND_013897 [Polypedilum vanderplanki]|uniref:Nucleoside diphosphate kinase n=1 Tax=Polypedilum vanderplanki TaxID=319348 RepID=A0A9J6CRW8_POLVA|nr:hypothetical protein PVAND_013897 [Polypedilum vanderplanki]